MTEPIAAFRFFIMLADSGSALKTGLGMLASGASTLLLDGGFSECTGLSMQHQVYEYREGGLADYVHQKPGQVSFGNITLKWGMGFNNGLWEWSLNNARGLAYGTGLSRKDGTLICLPYTGGDDPLAMAAGSQVWYFKSGIPVRWQGPNLNAASSQVAIESIEIAHQGLERWFPPNMAALVKGVTTAAAGAVGISL